MRQPIPPFTIWNRNKIFARSFFTKGPIKAVREYIHNSFTFNYEANAPAWSYQQDPRDHSTFNRQMKVRVDSDKVDWLRQYRPDLLERYHVLVDRVESLKDSYPPRASY